MASDIGTLPQPLLRRPIWALVLGIVLVLLGAAAIIMPQISTLAVELMIAWLFLLSGFIYGWSTLSMRRIWNIVGTGIVAILSLLVGGLLLLNPLEGILTLTLVMTAFFLAAGLVKIYYGIRNRDVRGWSWALASGIASIVIGALILLGWPSTAAWALGLLFGIDLVFAGFSLVAVYGAHKQS